MQRRGIVRFIPNPESCRVMRDSGGRTGTRLGAAAPNFQGYLKKVDADGIPAVIGTGYKVFYPYLMSV